MRDALGESIKKRIREDLGINVNSVRTIEIYTFDAALSKGQVKLLGERLFAESCNTVFSDKPIASDFSWLIEVGLDPG